MPIKITLRKKPITKNRESLYLDFYPAIPHPETGKPTRREFLGMYLYLPVKYLKRNGKQIPVYDLNPSISATHELHNVETLKIAEAILQKRNNAIGKPEIYTDLEKEQLKKKELGELSFIEYFKHLTDKRKASNHDNWVSALNYLLKFTDGNLKFADLNEKWCSEFREYLLTTPSNRSSKTKLSQNSAVSYFNKLKAALKQAYKDGYLQNNLNSKIEPIRHAETQRVYLTLEELNRLVKTECNLPILKQAAIFSALTGLRFSDIEKLVWSELEYIEGQGYFIQFKQQKTKGVEVLPISEQAYSLLGERKEHTDKVFTGLKYSAYHNTMLLKWVINAGITKEITFHCFRHTYAVLQLANGTDIYTVSKMLGHRELKTTQIYAQVVDKAKREAADKIKLDL